MGREARCPPKGVYTSRGLFGHLLETLLPSAELRFVLRDRELVSCIDMCVVCSTAGVSYSRAGMDDYTYARRPLDPLSRVHPAMMGAWAWFGQRYGPGWFC